MPGEVSHEEAHRIGVELADKLLEGKYSYTVSTHTDKGHVIREKALEPVKKRVPFPARKKNPIKDYSSKKLIDTAENKFAESPGLKHWADIQNLKIAASSYSAAGSISELEKQIATKSTLAKTA